jgi:hypothetical protein
VQHEQRYIYDRNILDLVTDYRFDSVPVIAVFTKFDALWDDAYGQLKDEGLTRVQCKKMAPDRAKEIFSNMKIWDRLHDTLHPPKDFVLLAGELADDFVCMVCNLYHFRNGQG